MGNPLRRQDVCCYYLLILLEKFLHQIEMCNESISILQGMAVWAASLERESQPGEQDSLGEPVYYPEVSEPFTGRQGSGVWGRVPPSPQWTAAHRTTLAHWPSGEFMKQLHTNICGERKQFNVMFAVQDGHIKRNELFLDSSQSRNTNY